MIYSDGNRTTRSVGDSTKFALRDSSSHYFMENHRNVYSGERKSNKYCLSERVLYGESDLYCLRNEYPI